MRKSKYLLSILALFLFVIVATGCVFGPSQDSGSEPIDPPQMNYTDGEDGDEIVFEIPETDEENEGEAGEMESNREVERTLYLFDSQGYVVPTPIQLPHTQSVATQALEYLVAEGPVTSLLPDGMRAVLPAGTEMTVKVEEDGTAVVDFSSEFKEYAAEDEKGILEAITWTLTQFDSIERVVIWIQGYPQEVMPVNGTPIGSALSRKDGINIEVAHDTNIGQSSVVTLYFKAQSPSGGTEYFVPVSRIIPRSQDLVMDTVTELIAGPLIGSGLVSDIVATTQLLDASIEEKVAMLDFNEQFLRSADETPTASDDALKALVLSLTETGLVEQVQFMVNGESNLVSMEGTDLSQPVSRPENINATGF